MYDYLNDYLPNDYFKYYIPNINIYIKNLIFFKLNRY